jgi:16S rRNA (uracil1498-N3)-methyltransferase
METRRIFVDKLKMKNGMVVVTGPYQKYIVTVLRKDVGERVDLIDGKGYLYRCVVSGIKGKELYLQVVDVVHHPEEKRPKVTLFVSPVKGPRMDWLVEKATELGVERIVPTLFKRTVIKMDNGHMVKPERWRKICIEASRQCGRFSVPEVTEPVPLRGILAYMDRYKHRWLLYEKERKRTIRDVMTPQVKGEICVAVGPEGGFEEGEVGWLAEQNFMPLTLGENILRTETTPLVVLSIIFYELNMR